MGVISNRLEGDVAFITGTGSGLNRGVALEFARHGCVCICADINESRSGKTSSPKSRQKDNSPSKKESSKKKAPAGNHWSGKPFEIPGS